MVTKHGHSLFGLHRHSAVFQPQAAWRSDTATIVSGSKSQGRGPRSKIVLYLGETLGITKSASKGRKNSY